MGWKDLEDAQRCQQLSHTESTCLTQDFRKVLHMCACFSGIGPGLPAAEVLGPGNPHLSFRSLLHLCPAHLPQPGPSRRPRHTQGPQWADHGGGGDAQWAKQRGVERCHTAYLWNSTEWSELMVRKKDRELQKISVINVRGGFVWEFFVVDIFPFLIDVTC